MTIIARFKSVVNTISTHILSQRMTVLNSLLNQAQLGFRLTSSHRGWPLKSPCLSPIDNFDSHPLTEDDKMFAPTTITGLNFDSHPLTEDDSWRNRNYPHCQISTHILSQRMTYDITSLAGFVEFRLTSSHRGWHKMHVNPHMDPAISTHILSQRMT